MRHLKEYVKALPEHKIPEHYRWGETIGISLKDLHFPNICDCLHKNYANKVEPFPSDFDITFFNKAQIQRYVVEYVEIKTSSFIMAQRFLDKERLLDLLDLKEVLKPIDIIRVKNYNIVFNGHHRLAIKYMKSQRIIARVGIMEL